MFFPLPRPRPRSASFLRKYWEAIVEETTSGYGIGPQRSQSSGAFIQQSTGIEYLSGDPVPLHEAMWIYFFPIEMMDTVPVLVHSL